MVDIKDDRCVKNRWEGGCSADQTLLLAGQLPGAKERGAEHSMVLAKAAAAEQTMDQQTILEAFKVRED